MDTYQKLLHWVYQEAHNLATSPTNNMTKAMAMSEIVYEAIDSISHWSSLQQREAINSLRVYLGSDDIPNAYFPQVPEVARISRTLLQAILDKTLTELEME